MTVEGNGQSGEAAAQPAGGPGPGTGNQGSGGATASGGQAGPGQAAGAKIPDDGATGKDTRTGQAEATLGGEKHGGRGRRQDDPLGLFADIKDPDLRHVYVKPHDDYLRACRALTAHRVVVLQGRPGSGRHAMARHLLLHGLRLRDIKLGQVETVSHTTELDKLQPSFKRSGHILERCPPERARRLRADELRAAAAILRTWEGYLVITVDDGVPVLEGEDGEQVVACAQVPDLLRVLKRHLKFYLRRHGGLWEEDREWLHGDTVRTHLARHPELRETVRKARELAGQLAADKTPGRAQRLNSRLDYQATPAAPETPEQAARRLLKDRRDVEHWGHVIALAVFHGGRPQFVADAAALLARRLAPADPRGDAAWKAGLAPAGRSGTDGPGQPLRRMALIVPDHVPAWQPGPTRSDWLAETEAELFEATEYAVLFNHSPARRVRYQNPSLRAAVLDYVWDELDRLRGPVCDWLEELGDHPDPEMHEQAATAVAYLASHGFAYVLELVIFPWMQRGGRARKAAALALGVLGRDDKRFTGAVLEQLSQWVRWGDDIERETAALAYGLAIGQDRPEVALAQLRALAMREGTEPWVVEAVYELFRRSRHREVLEALDEWTARPARATWRPADQRRSRTGLLAFLEATRVYDETPRWPFLVAMAEEGGDLRQRIIVLWRRALADDAVGELASLMLCGWMREADVQAAASHGRQPDLIPALARLAAGIADQGQGDQGNRGRVRHALQRCAHAREDPSDVARKLVEQLG